MSQQTANGYKYSISIEQLEDALRSIKNQRIKVFIGNINLSIMSDFSFECKYISTGENYMFRSEEYTHLMIDKKEIIEASISCKNGNTDIYIRYKNRFRFNIAY